MSRPAAALRPGWSFREWLADVSRPELQPLLPAPESWGSPASPGLPGVSVVIPTFNRPQMTAAAVESVLGQTARPLEVIVVDDCSTDGSADFLRSAFASRPEVSVLSLEVNSGACAARNAGLRRCSGEWVAFLDSDDEWAPEKLERQLASLDGRDAVASFAGLVAKRNGKVTFQVRPPLRVVMEDLLVENVLGSTSCLMARREALFAIGGFDTRLPACQDWDLYIRLLTVGPGVGLPEPLVAYSDGGHERISGSLGKVMAGHRAVFARARSLITDPALLGRARARHALWRPEELWQRAGSRLPAFAAAALAALLNPRVESFRRLAYLPYSMLRARYFPAAEARALRARTEGI